MNQTIHDIFEYREGKLFWKNVKCNRVKVEREAGHLNRNGYRYVMFNGKRYFAHRLIWLMQYGYIPDGIDHINGNRSDNRIENLRAASVSENSMNAKKRSDNTSGIKGVSLDKRSGKWLARCTVAGKKNHIGLFKNINDAAEAVRLFRENNHGEFANHGEKQ